MSSPNQAFANQQNAQSSTGPRTDAGKQTSSRNATKWGLTAQSVVIKGEDKAAYEALLAQQVAEYDPKSLTEHELVAEVAANSWRLARARRIETELFDAAFGAVENVKEAFRQQSSDFDKLRRYMTSLERAYFRAIDQLRKIQQERRSAAMDAAKLHLAKSKQTTEDKSEFYDSMLRNYFAPLYSPTQPNGFVSHAPNAPEHAGQPQ
jgi:hypothetical protein